MDVITIRDLAVLCRIGVPDEERSKPQRLLITVRISGDFAKACQSDDIGDTINYYDVSRRVAQLCRDKTFRLIEKLAEEIAAFVLRDFGAKTVKVQVKKFILSDARYVSFELERTK